MRHLSGIVIIFLSILSMTSAIAGNEDSYLLGNEASMASGALVSTTHDSGAVWYNPAGLGGIERSKIDVSSSAFVLNIRRMPGLLVTQLETTRLSAGVEETDLRSVPTGLAYVRDISKRLSIGFGIYVPRSDSLSVTSSIGAETSFASLPGVPVDYRQRVEVFWDRSSYSVGMAFGWQVIPQLRLGGALFFTGNFDEERFLTLGEGHNSDTGGDQRYSLRQYDREATAIGVRLVFGLQYRPHRRVGLGLVVRSPELSFFQWGKTSELLDITEGLIDGQPGGLTFSSQRNVDSGVDQVAPWRVNFGISYHFDSGWISVEGDFQTPLDNEAFNIHRNWVWNLRIGTIFEITDRLSLGGGLFTDRSGDAPLDRIGSWTVDFYGGTFGISFRTPISLRDQSRTEPLIFCTTLSLRYALGFGESVGYYLEPSATGSQGYSSITNDVIFHELTANIGSALFF